MTALRPEHDAGYGAPYERREPYEGPGAFEAAVDGLVDPLNDPLPGQGPAPVPPPAHPEFPAAPAGPGIPSRPGISGPLPEERPWAGHGPYPYGGPSADQGQDWASQAASGPPPLRTPPPGSVPPVPVPPGRGRRRRPEPEPEPPYVPAGGGSTGSTGGAEDATAVLPAVPAPEALPEPAPDFGPEPGPDPAPESGPGRPVRSEPATGGRAERRKAAKGGRGRGRTRPAGAAGPPAAPGAPAPSRPLSRVEARKAARALKDSPGVVLSRAVGEIFISFGVLMLLFVAYQLWWTNVRADLYAGKETDKIQDGWAKGRQPGAFEPGQGFAIMHIPKLDVVVPIAEGIDKAKVLDRGMVGHYAEGRLKTAMPSDKQGNFSVAGHRNTHGEPFRYINRLVPGDKIVVETQDSYFTYDMASILPQTPPSNVSVIQPVPQGSGFTGPGRYITLTTCTPEFTSTYRMIVWGKMVEERPRDKGKPDALVD
ncbi:class E sortase [Streptomyces sp. NBC_01498]|uniref:class E sortase n=1 Tax=Streptomyces sp. NBC_01498 TaxID=2975870 RepID=UPI002E7B97E5|nr:class E sortase [Streptomyces sp. NBC_01498]WTL25923.1 class E sortase [Streptomyces sp. NBC_01498]